MIGARLHLHHRAGGALQAAEVGEQIGFTSRLELIRPLVIADLREDVGRGSGSHRVRAMSEVVIRPVASRGDLRAFVELPYRLYTNEANWVPPLRFERRQFLDRGKNPYFEHATAEYFLAERGGRAVGADHRPGRPAVPGGAGLPRGALRLLRVRARPEAAAALLDAARRWLTAHGCDAMVGPQDFTMNDECGVLVEGHERPPIIGTGWHHRHYPELLEGGGLSKAMDLYMWELHIEGREKGPAGHLGARRQAPAGARHPIRHASKRNLKEEMRRFIDIYNVSWERNWGFSP
jgi:hypothetical protein